jgi:hypothetical protein
MQSRHGIVLSIETLLIARIDNAAHEPRSPALARDAQCADWLGDETVRIELLSAVDCLIIGKKQGIIRF